MDDSSSLLSEHIRGIGAIAVGVQLQLYRSLGSVADFPDTPEVSDTIMSQMWFRSGMRRPNVMGACIEVEKSDMKGSTVGGKVIPAVV